MPVAGAAVVDDCRNGSGSRVEGRRAANSGSVEHDDYDGGGGRSASRFIGRHYTVIIKTKFTWIIDIQVLCHSQYL